MKSRKSVLLVVIAILIIIGIIMTVQNKNLFADRTLDFRSPREKQLAYLKENKKEIEDFVKSLSPKVESVQIAWEQTQWDQIGNGTPQGGGDIVQVYGGFNNIEKSSWSVVIEIENGKVLIDTIGIVSPLSIGGDLFE
jgi:hypothetical protein